MTIFGWDSSHYDAPTIGAAIAEGFSFFTHKAGGDSASGDPELAAWWGNVRGTDPGQALLGTYWVPRPDLNPNPAREAERWIATLDVRCPGWRLREHILQMDAEVWNGNPATKPGKAYLQALGDRIVTLAPKLRPICYASAGQYGDSLAGLTFPLWNARYVLGYQTGTASELYARSGGDSGKGWNKYSGQVPAVWQFTSSATIAGQTTCDANAFRGTLKELKTLVAPGWAREDLTMSTDDFVKAFQDPQVQAAFNTMQAGAISKIKSYDFADGKDPHGQATWAEHMGHAPNTSGGRTEQAVADLTAKVDKLTALLEAHISGVIEGGSSTGVTG